MTAALDYLATEGEGVTAGAHPIDVDGKAGRDELARHCAEIWLYAIKQYMSDAQAAMRGVTATAYHFEALEDLTGSRRLLANLCRPLDIDPARAGDAMIEALDSGRRFDTAAMNRAVVERPEDYRLGAWRERTKRRGRPEPITLGKSS